MNIALSSILCMILCPTFNEKFNCRVARLLLISVHEKDLSEINSTILCFELTVNFFILLLL